MKILTLLRLPLFVLTIACPVFANPKFDIMLDDLLKGTVKQLTTNGLTAALKVDEKKPILLDTRSKKEFLISRLEGAQRVGFLDFSIDRIAGLDKDAPIVVYCSVGKRSEMIGEKLTKAGFTNVRNLRGGIFQWANDGRPLVNENGPTKTVHSYNRKWGQWLNDQVPRTR